MSRPRGWVGPALVATTIVAVAVGSALVRSGGSGDAGPDRQPSFPRVEELRAAAAHCTEELAAEEERFRAHERTVDSLRAAVSAYESAERTVPAELFDPYLETFTAYNEAVHDWEGRATAWQERWEACRDLAERHNALVDSLTGRPPVVPTLGPG
jgi:hypothetical protein